MTFIIPPQSTKKHSQLNKDQFSGTIYQSRNINLDETGYIKLASPSYAVMTTDNDADFSDSDAMYPMGDELYVNSDEVFTGDIATGTFTSRKNDTTPPSPGVENDLVFFNGVAVVSDGTTIKYEGTATTWTTIGSTSLPSTSGVPTCLTTWDAATKLVIARDNIVKFVDTSWTVSGTVLTLPASHQVSSMCSLGSQLFIATRSKSGGEAKLFVANSIATSATSAYGVGTFEIMSVKPFKSSVVLVNSLGQLLRFNGGGFDELASLPIYNSDLEWEDASNDNTAMSNRAMVTDGDLIYINVSSFTENGRYRMLPNFPSGVWCYDSTINSLYHRYSPSFTTLKNILGTAVTVSTTNNNFTLTSGNLNDVSTGMPMLFTDGSTTLIPELLESTLYFLIKDSSTEFRMATTYTNALAGTAIDISSTGNTSQRWHIFKINDYGWALFGSRMALSILNTELFNSVFSGRIAMTANLAAKQNLSTNETVLCGVSPFLPNRGYFVTPRLSSSNKEDIYNNIVVKYKPLDTDDKIIVKYKDRDKLGYPLTSVQYTDNTKWAGTWTDTDTFTTTADLSDVVAGEEVEIIAGVGSGHIAHISSITENSGTYTVNLDETFPFAVANDLMWFIVDNWTVAKTITSANQDGYEYCDVPTSTASKFLQVKVEMRGVGTTIEELIIKNKTYKPI